jgi:hypothetical protein
MVVNRDVNPRTRRKIRWTVFFLALVVLGIYLSVFLERL